MWVPEGVQRTAEFERPFFTFLLKIASRCNLDCDYCYVYRSVDQSWRGRPRFMSEDVIKLVAARIAEHVTRHEITAMAITLHGGEPLLAGPRRIERYIRVLQEAVPCQIEFSVQTNGTLITEEILNTLYRRNIRIGISIDGDRTANDLNRRYRNDSSSYAAVRQGIGLVRSRPEWERLLGGFLIVVDLRNDPDDVYQAMLDLGATSIDLLLPDCHHDAPPPRPAGRSASTVYGRWLSRFFDRWYSEQSNIELRFFDEIITLMLGGPSAFEGLGAKSVDLIVVETDGDIEAVDTLKIVGRHATSLGMNVRNNSFDDALAHPAIYSRMMGYNSLCSTCRQCPELKNCGGGYLPHRYGRGNAFLNESVYCEDLKHLFSQIRARIQRDLAAARHNASNNVTA